MIIENIKRGVLTTLLFGENTPNTRAKLARRMRRDEHGEYLQNFSPSQIDKLIKFIESDYFKLKEIKHRRYLNKEYLKGLDYDKIG